MCVRVCVRACVRAYVGVRMWVCVRACVRACVLGGGGGSRGENQTRRLDFYFLFFNRHGDSGKRKDACSRYFIYFTQSLTPYQPQTNTHTKQNKTKKHTHQMSPLVTKELDPKNGNAARSVVRVFQRWSVLRRFQF